MVIYACNFCGGHLSFLNLQQLNEKGAEDGGNRK